VSSVFKALPLFLAILVASFLATTTHAQTVRWEPGSGTLAFNQLSELSLVFDQCEPEGPVSLPAVPGLTFNQPPARSESTSFSFINGNATRTRTVTLVYRVRPTERLRVTIPAFQVETNKGRQPVLSASFDIGDATVGQSNLSLDSISKARISAASSTVWTGEVFPINYSLDIARRYFYQLGGDPEWNSAPFTAEPWGKPELIEAVVNDDPRVSIRYKTRAYAKAPGTAPLNSVSQLVNLATGSSGFGLFSRASLEQFALTAPPSTLTVKPLPSPAPAGFTGAVGQFTLDSKVVPAAATVGEPITWTLTLDGTGNWPDIAGLPSRPVSKDLTPITPQAKRINKNDSLFDASFTEDVVLIPTKPGTYTLGPVVFTVFNPATGAYENLSTKPVTIKVGGAPTTSSSSTGSAGFPAGSDPSDPQLKLPPSTAAAAAPAAVAALPRDPLPPSGTAFTPLSRPTLLISLLSAILCPLTVWFTLALRRARRTDPALDRREARIRLSTTLRALADSGQVAQASSLLQSWRRDTVLLLRLPFAEPTSAHFNDPAWATLWSEADRTLYGNAPLPADWITRANAALAAKPVPAFNPFQLFLSRNLLPLLALALLVPGGRTAVSAETLATDGALAYSKSDYPTAEKTWRDALASAPADWTAHHNLALALIQQNRPGEAAGHALAAFVQQPQNDSVRRTVAYAYKSAALTPPPVAQPSTLNAQLAALASPTRWQFLLILSAWLGAAATALTLYAAYQRRSPSVRSSFVIRHSSFRRVLAILSILTALAAAFSLRTYGPLADARAVVVVTSSTLRSIPTDLDTQKTTPLSLGVIATADKTFLGWTRLRFPDGKTGWTRTETLVALWK
jgi:hypothetical protein